MYINYIIKIFNKICPPYSIDFMEIVIDFLDFNGLQIFQQPKDIDTIYRIMAFIEYCEDHSNELKYETIDKINSLINQWINN